MKHGKRKHLHYFLATFCLCFLAAPVGAADDAKALKARVESLENELSQIKDLLRRQVQSVVTKEEIDAVKKQVENVATKEEVNAVKRDVEVARKEQAEWKEYDSRVHLGGFAKVGYADNDSGSGRFNQAQFNPIFHYTYKDLILLEAELELRPFDDGTTETILEYLTIDWFMNDYMALIMGKFLTPIGQFRQILHPGWINKLPTAPPGFGNNQAAPVAEVGIQLRGGLPFGNNMQTNYAFFVGNGPTLTRDGGEITGVDSEGFTANDDGDKIFGGRIAFLPIPAFEIAFSGSTGDVSVAADSNGDRDHNVIGFDFSGHWKDLTLHGEYVKQEVGGLAGSVAPAKQEWETWYTQLSYKIPATKFETVVRYTDYVAAAVATGNSRSQTQWALGLNYLFASNVIFKVAYELNDGLAGTSRDQNNLYLQFVYGF